MLSGVNSGPGPEKIGSVSEMDKCSMLGASSDRGLEGEVLSTS